ncbi:MAG: fructosamine kinase family protein [Chlamydiales bacterium]|nr:fructosamine kinase family protein [Chlamydiia bacterium]MCP5507913.1 fructosamine kinase family protein [Chlamydiales bacterium]
MIENAIDEALRERLGCKVIAGGPLISGMLNATTVKHTDKGDFFVKVNTNAPEGMFAAESYGLQAITATETVRVPIPFHYENNFLILEYIPLMPHTASSQQKLGEQLAALHLHRGSDRFGFNIDNTIGTTPQPNRWNQDWIAFFRDNRLLFQLEMTENVHGDTALRKAGEALLYRIEAFFSGMTVAPSLIHGDLWAGNTAADSKGEPVIFDPAPYYGHHEADLSIAAMFGGFHETFYHAYHESIPKAAGFDERHRLYQLYHYLNHYNLFGSAYRSACMSLINSLS